MRIIDGHIHVFSTVNGANANGPVRGVGLGRTENAGVVGPFIPPLGEGTAFTLPMLRETLSQNGVDKAVLLQNPTIGDCNELIGRAIADEPETFAGVVQVDPFAPDACEALEALLDRYPYAALKLELSTGWGWTGIHHAADFRYDMLRPLLDTAAARGLAVIFDTGDTDSYAYLPEELCALARAYPALPFVLEHGGYLTPEGDVEKWERMIRVGLLDNVWVGICAMGVLLNDPYPCPAAEERLRQLYTLLGAEKLIWGTDAPTTLKMYTYRQMLDTVRLHAPFLSPREKELVLGENALRLYFERN